MKINDFYIGIFLLTFISCKENLSNSQSYTKVEKFDLLNKKMDLEENSDFILGDTTLMKKFLIKLIKTCKTDSTVINGYFTENVRGNYKQNFCFLLNDAYSNKEGKVNYRILKNSDKCKGVIEIYSVNYFLDENGEKYRNEYSTYFYIIKKNGDLFIDEIGGSG